VTGKSGSKTAQQVGARIQDTLSAFYDAAFADPAAWSGTVPAGAWDAFDASLRDRARHDAASLTIGAAGAALSTLTFPQSKLTVRVLVDQHGKAQAAIATVAVDGTGTTTDGAPMALTNRASFILEPSGGTWRILGYPHVNTSVEPGS
jgi:ketosteroid isomerase-like protein